MEGQSSVPPSRLGRNTKKSGQSSTMVDLTEDEIEDMGKQLRLDDWKQWMNPHDEDDSPIVLD